MPRALGSYQSAGITAFGSAGSINALLYRST
jgi:hypothetical protein